MSINALRAQDMLGTYIALRSPPINNGPMVVLRFSAARAACKASGGSSESSIDSMA